MNNRTYLIREGKTDLDLYAAFSVFVAEDGYRELVAYPPMKKVAVNEWPEEDGSDPDLTDPKLDIRNLNIIFGCTDAHKTNAFLRYLSTKSYHKFDFREIGLVRTLRLVAQTELRTVGKLRLFSLQFADDLCELRAGIPSGGEGVVPPPARSQGVFIDGMDLAENWGVSLIEGTMDSLAKAPPVRQNLLINTSDTHGALYDDAGVFFTEQKATLRLFIKAPDRESFWNAYNGLLAKLIEPDERDLYFAGSDEHYYFYYDKATVSRFTPTPEGGVWCEFSLALNFTSYRPGHTEFLLTAEDGSQIVTEDCEEHLNVFIDMGAAQFQ